MWTTIFLFGIGWLIIQSSRKIVTRVNTRADARAEQFADSVTRYHEERVSYWLQELDSAKTQEYRDYCQQQVDYWHWNTPRVRADVLQRWAAQQ